MSLWMNGVVNPTMTWLLRSPLQRLVNRGLLLISVTGRKSGTVYQTPVAYVRDGATLLITTRRTRQWWKNLRTNAPVTLVLQGCERAGEATVVEEEAIIAATLHQFYNLVSPRRITPAKAATLASSLVMIRIRLRRETDAPTQTSAHRRVV
jgi:deazaflavin-dependent oxidoreductase (nitroreductase family)